MNPKNRKRTGLLMALACLCLLPAQAQQPVDRVNMFIGTTGAHSTEYGGTTPAVSEPFGMTQWCAATRINGISSTMYHHNDSTLIGFMATHQPAIWMGDYGFMTLMPQVGSLKIGPRERAVKLNRETEVATPYYYKVSYEGEPGQTITTELTATSRSAALRVNYPKGRKALMFLEAGRWGEGGSIEIYPERREVRIYNRERHDSHLGPELKNLKGYYVLRFSKPFASFGTWNGNDVRERERRELGSRVGGYVAFAPGTEVVEVRVGSSFIDYAQAADNLARECPSGKSFDGIKSQVKKTWAKCLGNISLKGASDEDQTIFYTSYFRTLQYPREFSEYGRYYSAFDDQIHRGVSYTAYSLWDTFRAQWPWLELVQPQRISPMVTALVQMYQEGGWIPKWCNPSYTNIMIGTHADAVIADAYVNGFRDYDVEEAYRAIRKDAFTAPPSDSWWGDRQLWNGHYEARGGLKEYLDLGYAAADRVWESVSRTLEFALDDYCVAQVAKGLGHDEDYNTLMQHAQNYRNLYNKENGFFQARRADGSWADENEGFTEGGRWTYRFCVMQDVPGLISLMGGKESFVKELDRNFDEGHYRHDNEPGHHLVYLYNHANRLDKAQERIPRILRDHYKCKPDGLSGNDDCGQMSAWYLFSSLGFYPLTPASGEYALGIPHFPEISLTLQNGRKLVIKAKELGKKATLTKVLFNGKPLGKPFIAVKDILQGGTLEFTSEE